MRLTLMTKLTYYITELSDIVPGNSVSIICSIYVIDAMVSAAACKARPKWSQYIQARA